EEESLANGYRLRGESPQEGVTCWLDCTVTAESDSLSVQFASRSGASEVLHRITHITGGTYQIHVGPCQLFVAIGNQRPSVSGTTVCGGIPYILPEPELDVTHELEAWWAMGDAPATGFSTIGRNPRSCLGDGINATAGSVDFANSSPL